MPVPDPSGRWSLLFGYSRLVVAMKVLLPALALLLIVGVLLWPRLVAETSAPSSLIQAVTEDVPLENRQMEQPRYRATDADNQPYTLNADRVWETVPGSSEFNLVNPRADMATNDGAWLAMDAPEGLYYENQSILDLSGGVNLYHDAGYELHTPSVTIDVAAGEAIGMEAVEGQGPSMTIASEGIHVVERGRSVLFTGKVRLVLYPEKAP
ncbi:MULTISPECIES: LPS export ABC transporter periplasmic protein LptC [unclassified Haematospirillum]|uniref:LPS export ABC transporter periplasmic protein LptC n=1 Tax=unclassified Haematospirillum TaxID=2622088 RepID=UPI0014389975|nr:MULTISPECIES: LPS export ABC transporter periplasmic protein LptC [unclassified Haematospirillum]NKD55693.1 LPS export ABC transporter periplasmic protein LptC [Haematospirillum sp. H4890]NKD75218.1 LPS export ABC transporter periplasmic protein LptC [Haematospirillum sp. H4485]NKD88563.1 LPS export ABC transporter periplasmic protein LptC [Haematospirillum sp. 15-248]